MGDSGDSDDGEHLDDDDPAPAASGIDVLDEARSEVDRSWVAARLGEVADRLGRPVVRVCVTLVDDRRMADLHRDHMDIDETTDVLTFPASEPGAPIDVDVAVCVDEARRQAARRGHPLDHEVLLYAVHALLHCAGHDDHDEADAARMHAEEDRLLRGIGVGAVFAREAAP